MKSILEKYAELLVNYSVSIQKGERVLIQSTTLAEPLVREVYKKVLQAGGLPHVSMEFRDQRLIRINESEGEQLDYVDPLYSLAVEQFDAYIFIRAPFTGTKGPKVDRAKAARSAQAHKPWHQLYMQRTGTVELKRTLCEYPTLAHAQNAGMTLEEYSHFIFHACHLYDEHPQAAWEKVSEEQQKIVDYLNGKKEIHYKGKGIDIRFSTAGRTWINSDGKTNMPSGEVYTTPVEDSVNGQIHFSYPSVFAGEDVEGITLSVKDGWIESWSAAKGKDLLDKIFTIEGARRFGEAAIGTNMRIAQPVRNILFDEKLGGTIHMAVGQSYFQTGGKNQSSVHWDMIADMKDGGEIFADGEKFYDSGKFLI